MPVRPIAKLVRDAACVAALAASLTLAGCRSVYVDTAPRGAEVYVDGELIGKTPCKFKAKTFIWLDYEVEIKKQGYKPLKETVDIEFGPGAQWTAISSLLFLSPLFILTPFFGDVVPPMIAVPLEPDFAQTPPADAGLIPTIPRGK